MLQPSDPRGPRPWRLHRQPSWASREGSGGCGRKRAVRSPISWVLYCRLRARGEEIRGFILTNVEKNSSDIVRVVGEHFGISRQAVNKHLKNLVAEGALAPEGKTRYRRYKLAALLEWRQSYTLGPEIEEDLVWSQDISLVLGNLPKNVMDISHFCITEIFNNAIDHSGGKTPKGHTGQGIFFTSRVLDSFDILSRGVFFTHTFGVEEDWILERPEDAEGTAVFMKLNNHSARTDKQIFDQYSSGDTYGFTKTVVPVRLAQYGDDKLISRSQAKRLLARVDRFKTVLFDFQAVESVGQAFADEIFRVFAQAHPNIEVVPINATPQVRQMINAAKTEWAKDVDGF